MITIHANANKIDIGITWLWPGDTEIIEELPEGAKAFDFKQMVAFKGIKMLFERLGIEEKKLTIQALNVDLEKEYLQEIYKDGKNDWK